MGELEFRRRIYEDPDSRDEDLLQEAESNESSQKFWQETRALNEKIKSAVDIPVPSDLADKLILQSTFQDLARQKKRSRVHLAMAASVAFVIGMTFTMWSPTQQDLGHAAIAHMNHSPAEFTQASEVSIEEVNDKLSSMGAQLIGDIGRIYSANFCRLDFVKSLHVVVDTDDGPVSVFFTPYDKDSALPERFSEDSYTGEGFRSQRANVMVVGDKNTDITEITKKVKASMNRA
ncbi:DUF3379 domain-containing protein [Alteromonas sp. 5E99-2]|uniref:DUF3379 family protein n=1 Tax=Alteromonas sp. 5E99-2 TaxID=2817683 RepID=UPI001A981FFF|nr:DUF3379 family protein [Alteromonas sp. 5E99-2]MBO1256077.1 DUF3379 domain-containing protein [Alteromonas sp. 5E99-2]